MNDYPLPINYTGLVTSIDPSQVPNGALVRAQNIRNDDGIARRRSGITLVQSSGLTTTYRGGGLFEFDGDVYNFFAMDKGGASPDVAIYWNRYTGGSWGTPAVISGNYSVGDIRNPDSGFVTFTGVPGDKGTAYVIVQNGLDNPLVITMAATPTVAPNEAVPAPVLAQSHKPRFTFPAILDITQSTPTKAQTDPNIAWDETYLANAWTLGFTSTTTAGETATIYNTNQVDLSNSAQLGFVMDGVDNLLNNFKIELRSATTPEYYTIHDPDNGINSTYIQETTEAAWDVVWFSIAGLESRSEIDEIVGIRVTSIRDLDGGGGVYMIIGGIIASGAVKGSSQYAVSWENTGTKAESPSVVLPNSSNEVLGTDVFGSNNNAIESVNYPIDSNVHYSVTVPTFAPESAQMSKGVDYMNIYRKDPDDAYFYYVTRDQVATHSGSWAYASPFTSTVRQDSITDTTSLWDKDTTRTAPGAYVESIPIGQAGAFSSDRLYFSSRGSDTSRPSVKVSDVKFPFRFRSLPLSGEEGLEGFEAVLDGEKEITAIIPASSSTIGAAGVYVFTKQGVYTIDGIFVAKVSAAGCLGAVAEDDTSIYFFDKDKQVRVLSGSIPNLSRYTVHDKFKDISDPSVMSFVRYQSRLYCKATGTSIMVWSDRLGAWEAEDVPYNSLVPAQFLKWNFYGQSKLYVAMTDGDLYEYESGTTDDSQSIPIGITWPTLHDQNYSQIRVGNPYIVCDDKTGETGVFTFTAQNPAASATANVDLDAPVGETATWTKGANSGKDVAVRGCSVSVKFDSSGTAPLKIYSVRVKSNVNAGRGARA